MKIFVVQEFCLSSPILASVLLANAIWYRCNETEQTVSSFKLQVFISQLGYVNKYKQHNIEQNKAMNLKI
jgi:hypothetical protein